MAQKIKFVTDSASDIPRSLREELDILVLPFPIAMGAREYQDGVDFTATEFYDMLLAAPQIPTHAQLTPFVFSQCFEEAFRQGYTDLIYTSINSKGSATHQNALQAREEFYEDRPEAEETFRIHILDSPPLYHGIRLGGGAGGADGPGGEARPGDPGLYSGLDRPCPGAVCPAGPAVCQKVRTGLRRRRLYGRGAGAEA